MEGMEVVNPPCCIVPFRLRASSSNRRGASLSLVRWI